MFYKSLRMNRQSHVNALTGRLLFQMPVWSGIGKFIFKGDKIQNDVRELNATVAAKLATGHFLSHVEDELAVVLGCFA